MADDPRRDADSAVLVEGLIWAAGQAVALQSAAGFAAARSLIEQAAEVRRERARPAAGPGLPAPPALRPIMTEAEWLAAYAPASEPPA